MNPESIIWLGILGMAVCLIVIPGYFAIKERLDERLFLREDKQ